MLRFHDRLRLCIWGVLLALVLQCVLVWLSLRSFRRAVRDEIDSARDRLASSYSVACSNAVERVGSVLSSYRPTVEDVASADADSAPRLRVLGVGRNGYYDYLDVATTDEFGVESVRRVYRRSSRPDPRTPKERRPPGY